MLTGLKAGKSTPAMTLSLASRCWPAQSSPTTDPPHISDEGMAWSLADAVKSYLTDYERTVVFVELGCEEGYLVIKHIITVLLMHRIAFPDTILWKLSRWLDGYSGSPEEPQLRMMLDVIRLQRLEPGSRDD